jgi:hypothetical protein
VNELYAVFGFIVLFVLLTSRMKREQRHIRQRVRSIHSAKRNPKPLFTLPVRNDSQPTAR